MPDGDIERGTGMRPVMLLASLGLALFLSATWTARADTSGVATAVIYATRIVTLVTCLVMAWMFRNHLPSVVDLAKVAMGLMAVHLAIVYLGTLVVLTGSVATVVDYASGAFEGVANALFTLLYAHILSTFTPRRSALGVGIAYLLVDVSILCLDLLPADVLHLTRPTLVLASALVLAFCVRLLMSEASVPAPDHALQYGMARIEGEDERPLAFLNRNTDWLLLLIVAVLFPNLFGIIAQVSSQTGGNFALYDVTTQVGIVALQALFLLFLGSYGDRYGFATILAIVVPLYATGFALFPGQWARDIPLAGFLIRSGYVLLTVLIWALMARKSYEDPRHTYLYFAIYCSVSDAQAGRLTGSFLMGDAGPSLPLCENISLAALWSICIFGLVIFFLLRRGVGAGAGEGFVSLAADSALKAAATGSVGAAEEDEAAGMQSPATSFATSGNIMAADQQAVPVDTFAARLEAFAARVQLTPREREVLVEAVHGYSRTNIAKKLYLSPETVKTYLNRAYVKAGVTSKQELVACIEREPLP